jgi:hypothetical protein
MNPSTNFSICIYLVFNSGSPFSDFGGAYDTTVFVFTLTITERKNETLIFSESILVFSLTYLIIASPGLSSDSIMRRFASDIRNSFSFDHSG